MFSHFLCLKTAKITSERIHLSYTWALNACHLTHVKIVLKLLDVDDGFLSLMDDNGDTKDDVRLPEGDLGKKMLEQREEGVYITILTAVGEEAAVGIKNQKAD